ncbi:MAG TPA: pyrroloquinoline quinone biosynthesis peptide chaperone PqqD [Salinisphaeraceae bacterium]|nr:pyrroloquinoline quinone biosynthesis peptide chaperone PqqD [Salinisphaeraceae bacterium]
MTTALEYGCPHLAPGFRMQWEAAQDCHVLLYPEGMVKLNASAHEILSRCNGNKTVATIVNELQQAFPKAELEDHVWQFLRRAEAQGWIKMAQP